MRSYSRATPKPARLKGGNSCSRGALDASEFVPNRPPCLLQGLGCTNRNLVVLLFFRGVFDLCHFSRPLRAAARVGAPASPKGTRNSASRATDGFLLLSAIDGGIEQLPGERSGVSASVPEQIVPYRLRFPGFPIGRPARPTKHRKPPFAHARRFNPNRDRHRGYLCR